MIKKHDIITLRKVSEESGTENGTGFRIPAALIGEQHKQPGLIGGDPGRRVYLLFPESVFPAVGDTISDNSGEYTITEIKVCRDVAGQVRAVCCTTLN